VTGIIFGSGWYFGDLKADTKNIELRNEVKALNKTIVELRDTILNLRPPATGKPPKSNIGRNK